MVPRGPTCINYSCFGGSNSHSAYVWLQEDLVGLNLDPVLVSVMCNKSRNKRAVCQAEAVQLSSPSALMVDLCLQVWRGTLARMRYRRMRAALVILQAYRRYKVKSYIREVNRRFKNVRSMKDYGRHVKWPAPPKVLRRFEEALRSIYSRYIIRTDIRTSCFSKRCCTPGRVV